MNKPKTLLEMEPKIAVVEDDLSLSNLLKRVLSQEGFSVKEFFTAESLISAVVDYKENFDLIIMDIMLPGVNGREACKFLREKGVEIPILMLTALSTEDDKVNSFESGADDYLTKPFSIRELIARVKALLRRKGFSPFPKTEIETYNLTKKEREILELLLRNRGRTCLLYTSPSPRDGLLSRMPSSA
jgi:DNA-binding response OmpR family regulator